MGISSSLANPQSGQVMTDLVGIDRIDDQKQLQKSDTPLILAIFSTISFLVFRKRSCCEV